MWVKKSDSVFNSVLLTFFVVVMISIGVRKCESEVEKAQNHSLELILSTKIPGITDVRAIDVDSSPEQDQYYVRFNLNKQSCYGKLIRTESVTVKHFEYQCEKLPATKSYE